MRHVLLLIALILLAGVVQAQTEVAVVVSPNATGVEKLAASELATHLAVLYPSVRFPVRDQAASGARVLLGTPASLPESLRSLESAKLETPESFSITTLPSKSAPVAVVAGADPRGVLFGVYALLEKLGFGFYLSYSTNPPARYGPFTVDGWAFTDRPLASTRLVFNWHNFLSGCSTWNLSDWQMWITQASRMRFNTIMVHAYGNNPMFSFTHNGVRKPTGYLSTTARGRDWGTQHVLDVRSIVGGAQLFDGPVFGANAGMVPENETAPAATSLMQKVFQSAAARGMGVTFALDVDTETSNPQNIIASLPPTAKFAVRGVQLVNPETPEGRAYYRSQVQQLLETYPEITQIAIWFRGGRNSPWREAKREDFPPSWREQYDRALQLKPTLRTDPEAPSMFAISKIATAFRAILDETNHTNVTLAAGSWRFEYLRSADTFMPPGVALIPLDYDYGFLSDPVQEAIRSASGHRPVVPIVWAHHDDRSYAGRPYLPLPGFASVLRRSNTAGYGIIHWTTRPLDLYFKSLADQVWSASENEQLETTCDRMAERTFGKEAREAGRKYLLDWIQDAPMFGRETSDRFIDQAVDEAPVLAGCRRRLQLLDGVRSLSKTPQALTWVSYFQNWEQFVLDFHKVHAAWQRSVAALGNGNIDQARHELAAVSPEAVMEQYARTIRHNGATAGEKGILISLNLRWLPYFLSQREVLGIEPLRISFAPTAPELLAQSPGKNTFAFDSGHHIWRVLGKAETGAEVLPAGNGRQCSGGLQVDHPISLSIGTIGGQHLPSGKHQLTLDMSPGSVVEVVIGDAFRFEANKNTATIPVTTERLDFTLRPVNGAASVCGIVLKLVEPRTPDL